MKKLRIIALILALSMCTMTLASCSLDEIFALINSINPPVEPTCEHLWVDATCTSPKTCSKCNATDGEALGHNDEDKNHDCDVCDGAMGTHEAAEGKHTCDYCGKEDTN